MCVCVCVCVHNKLGLSLSCNVGNIGCVFSRAPKMRLYKPVGFVVLFGLYTD